MFKNLKATMTIITISQPDRRHPHLRPFDVRKDLGAVADLVERCFVDSLDDDGRRYIRQMREMAKHPNILRWTGAVADQAAIPFSGYVWVQDDRLVGNLSRIALPHRGKRILMLANIAVDPEYRRQGIARSLVEMALEHSRARRADAIWLHVRADNPGAVQLYQSLGFEQRSIRTTWRSSHSQLPSDSAGIDVTNIQVAPRRSEFWPQQRLWLARLHPDNLQWHLPLNTNLLRPGLLGSLSRLLKGAAVQQWTATLGDQLIGTASWQRTMGRTNRVWLTTKEGYEDQAAWALVRHLRSQVSRRRALTIDYPTGLAEAAFEALGFAKRQTLIWMEQR
jgi:ribosomal protein S18 acetylase RimI-like enzyme